MTIQIAVMILAVCWTGTRPEIFDMRSDYYDVKPNNLACRDKEWRLQRTDVQTVVTFSVLWFAGARGEVGNRHMTHNLFFF